MTIHIGTDHAGYELKNALVHFLRDELGHDVVDHGAHTYDAEDDYPFYMHVVGHEVVRGGMGHFGVVLGGSGSGEVMAVNKVPGVRAFQYYGGNTDIVKLSREHNDANVISLGARFVSQDEAKEALRLWLATPFSGEARHIRRIQKIEAEKHA